MEKLMYNEKDSILTATEAIKQYIADCNVFVCIGTESVISDSLGPQVGEIINENADRAYVYGLPQKNITAQNLERCFDAIRILHQNSKIAVIDAAVGSKNQIGEIQIDDMGIYPGAATGKNLKKVGDVSIVGVVAQTDMTDFYSADKSKRSFVKQLAQVIGQSIVNAVNAD
ncbi:MAG: spore protease YyaC [Corallococcus sp.]|nr:spore protease YyaC [Corallococcus sp.]